MIATSLDLQSSCSGLIRLNADPEQAGQDFDMSFSAYGRAGGQMPARLASG
jgi:hypothetical protein